MLKTVILTLVVSSSVFAADLNLLSGESAIIEANSRTRVTCNGSNGGGMNCEGAGNAFKKIMEYCYKSHDGGTCAKNHWPNFKKDNPNCSYTGVETCIDYCYKGYDGGTCASLCQ